MSDRSNNSVMTSSVRAIIGAEVLVIDRDESVRNGVAKLAAEAKMNATCVADPSDAWEMLRERFFSVVVVDLDSPTPNAGVETVTSIKMISPTTSILVLTPRKSYESAVEVIRAGASDIVHKSPDSVIYLKDLMMAAAARSQQRQEMGALLKSASSTHENFLQLLMTTEREVLDLRDKVAGRDPKQLDGQLRVLVVDRSDILYKGLKELAPNGYQIDHAQTGGEALDRGSSKIGYHFAFVADDLPDLPQSMVVRSLSSQNSELIALTFRGPKVGGTVELVGTGTTVVSNFTETAQLVARLPDLAEAFHAKEKQRRYTQAFREKHYDFVRSFVSLKEKLDLHLPD
ncbi:MAG: response regulator [Kofleriaceae bacterium]|nr:response regulator [Kofleriaceae bacterium]